MTPKSFAEIEELLVRLPQADSRARIEAEAREAELTKPPGALGRLEALAGWLAAWQGRHPPRLDRVSVLVFAGSHGVARRGVSAFPAEVTAQMVQNFEAGGAAINQLSDIAGAELRVLALDIDQPTADFTVAPAMTTEECMDAFATGFEAIAENMDLLALGEMGIGNTTVAAAIATALYGGGARRWVGPGTGLDDAGIGHKADVVDAAIARHAADTASPLDILRRLGGREVAALAGAILAARLRRVPVLLDGYVVTAAAAVLHALNPQALNHAMAAHRSAEPAHGALLDRLGKRPLLDLDMRLGEASGAALAILLVRAALAAHTSMATFAEAGVAISQDAEPS